MISAVFRCGSTNWRIGWLGSAAPQLATAPTFSKLGLTNPNHCLITPSTSRPRSLTSRRTTSVSKLRSRGKRPRGTHFSARDKCLHQLRRRSVKYQGSESPSKPPKERLSRIKPSYPSTLEPLDHRVRKCPPESEHAASKWLWSARGVNASRKNKPVSLHVS